MGAVIAVVGGRGAVLDTAIQPIRGRDAYGVVAQAKRYASRVGQTARLIWADAPPPRFMYIGPKPDQFKLE
jgi:hypothetical protein